MQLYHDSYSPLCRLPAGAVPCGESVMFRVRCSDDAASLTLRFYDGSEKWFPMRRELGGWHSVSVKMPAVPILCWYDFRAKDGRGNEYAYGGPQDGMGGEGHFAPHPHAWQITVYDPAYKTPEWLRTGVMYQIFPDRFSASGEKHPRREECFYHEAWDDDPILMPEGGDDNCARDFFGGDLRGIREKLPYLASLGVTVLYLNPIFQARSNHRYDTADYLRIDPLLGTNEDFSALCGAAKEYGIRVMLDGVFSHTGEDSVYFNRYGRFPSVGACQSTKSPYYPWYKFIRYPDDYKAWWGFHTLPELEKNDPSYQDFMFREGGVVRSWIANGSSGWRLDVADELTMDFLRKLRAAAKKEDPDAVVLGEVWEDASHKVAYGEMRCYCQGDTLDSVMNYPLRSAAIDFFTGRSDAYALLRLIRSQKENYPLPFYYSLMNLAGSHDRARSINTLCGRTFEEYAPASRRGKRLTDQEYALGKKRYVEMMRLLCALPGIPCVYYGDERGAQGGPDPFCRGTFPWAGGDRELEEQIRALLLQRRQSPILQTGGLTVSARDADTLVIKRWIEGGTDVFGNSAEDGEITVEITR
ncbi:MAG: glycoside hydrolase family 13 protein [Clostridia bacterium]|nr:glycoside hydrolase family 13 protein [Clostridia bacterium]